MNLLSRTTPVLLSLAFIFCLEGKAQMLGGKKIVGSGKLTTETVTIPAYDKIALTGFMDVHLVAGKEGQIKVTAEDNLHEYLNIAVKNGTLNISIKSGFSLRTKKDIDITVPVEGISGVHVVGSGDMDTERIIQAPTFKASVTGSGDLNLKVEATKVAATIMGSGDLMLSGATERLSVVITGSGDFKGLDLSANDTEVTISGSGDAKVRAKTILKATIIGSGDIAYKGNPKEINKKVMGSGNISTY